MRHFINLIEGKEQKVCDFYDGKKALQITMGVLQSGRYNQPVIFD